MMQNLRKRFEALLPSDPLLVGTVIDTDGNTTRVEFPQGGQVTVMGGGVDPGSRVFIQSGRVQGEAPDLPLVQADV